MRERKGRDSWSGRAKGTSLLPKQNEALLESTEVCDVVRPPGRGNKRSTQAVAFGKGSPAVTKSRPRSTSLPLTPSPPSSTWHPTTQILSSPTKLSPHLSLGSLPRAGGPPISKTWTSHRVRHVEPRIQAKGHRALGASAVHLPLGRWYSSPAYRQESDKSC